MFVECYSDEVLVSALGITLDRNSHRQGIGNVCNKLKTCTNAKGMVDEDPGRTQPNYLSQLKVISDEHSIKVLCDAKTKNCVIMLCPRLEEWVLQAAKETSVDVTEFGLPNDAITLHRTLSSGTKRRNLIQLIKEIKGRSPMLNALEALLKK